MYEKTLTNTVILVTSLPCYILVFDVELGRLCYSKSSLVAKTLE